MFALPDEEAVLERLVDWGEADDAIRALVLTSSRARGDETVDLLSDYDVIAAVRDVAQFAEDESWVFAYSEPVARWGDEGEVHGVGKIHDIFAGVDIDHSHPTKSNIEGIQQTESLLRELEDGFVFVNLVETDMLWGHRNDPLNFHRCLQDFDRRLPDLLEALRPNDLFILTSDHGCDPTTPSTDHSREHALLLAYVEGRNEDGGTHEGEFADVGATVNAWLGGKPPGRGIPGAPLLEQT